MSQNCLRAAMIRSARETLVGAAWSRRQMSTKTAHVTNRSLWITAYHEAGHAVVAFRLGLRIGRGGITIAPSEDSSGTAHILLQLSS